MREMRQSKGTGVKKPVRGVPEGREAVTKKVLGHHVAPPAIKPLPHAAFYFCNMIVILLF